MPQLPILIYILIFTLIGSVLSLIGGFALLWKKSLVFKTSHLFISLAAGTLLGTAFFDLLPEAIEEGKSQNIFFWTLVGIILFFLLERSIHWFHFHHDFHEEDVKPVVPLIVLGDTLHNFIDGVVIAASFLVSLPLGIVTALAVGAHEIPQEMGDFGILLHEGLSRKKVVLINFFSSLVSLFGAVLTFYLKDLISGSLPVILALTAGFFIYIASSDLIPEIHHEKRKGFKFYETALLFVGIFIIWITVEVLH